MFYEGLLTDEEKSVQEETRRFAREEVSPDFMRAGDRDEITYPRRQVEKLAEDNLLGLRFDPQWGADCGSCMDSCPADAVGGVSLG